MGEAMKPPEPYWAEEDVRLYLGDCLDVLRTMEADSIDAIVTDPPAGIAFMDREWDDFRRARNPADAGRDNVFGRTSAHGPEYGRRDRGQFVQMLTVRLAEAYRVLKPGGHALVWSIPRTSHWTAWAIEDAGFDIRDCVLHLFGSGFPKSRGIYQLDVLPAVKERYGEDARCSCVDARDGSTDRDHGRCQGREGAGDHGERSPVQATPTRPVDLSFQPGTSDDAVRELRDSRQAPRKGSASVPEAVLQPDMRGRRPEAAGLGDAALWAGLEEPQGRDPATGQGVPGVREDADRERPRTPCASSGAVPVRRIEPAGEPGSSVRFVSSHDRSRNGSGAGVDSGRSQPRRVVSDGDSGRRAEVARVCSWCGLPDRDWLRSIEALGTSLKPGQEMWWLARKPLAAGTVAGNVLQFGTGALNIGGCKVAHASEADLAESLSKNPGRDDTVTSGTYGANRPQQSVDTAGRWPTNIVFTHSAACEPIGTRLVQSVSERSNPTVRAARANVAKGAERERREGARGYGNGDGTETVEAWACADDCPVGELDRQSGVVKAGGSAHGTHKAAGRSGGQMGGGGTPSERTRDYESYGDTGGASRFYPTFRYQAKAPASERPRLEDGTAHECVKSLDLTRWQVRLITPPGGTCLDMFGGSGPVPEACIIEGFRCIVIEQDPKSAELIKTRLSKPIQPVMLTVDDSAQPARPHPVAAARPKPPPEAHPSLFEEMDAAS